MENNLILYLLCGVPASGKTTLSKQLTEENDTICHSYDDMPNARVRDYKLSQQVYKQWIENIKTDLLNGRSVVVDNTSLTVDFRKKFLSEFYNIPCKKILIVMDTPIDTCIQRNSQRQGVEKVPKHAIPMASYIFEEPSYCEGWNLIKKVSSN